MGRFWDVPGPLGKALEKSSLIAAGYNGSPVMEARKKRKVPNLSKKHEQKTEVKNAKNANLALTSPLILRFKRLFDHLVVVVIRS